MLKNKKLKYSLYSFSAIAVGVITPISVISCGSTTSTTNSFSTTSFINLYGPVKNANVNFLSINQTAGTNENDDLVYSIKKITYDANTIANGETTTVKTTDFSIKNISNEEKKLNAQLILANNATAEPGNYYVEIEVQNKTSKAVVTTLAKNFDVLKVITSLNPSTTKNLLASFSATDLLNVNGLLSTTTSPFEIEKITFGTNEEDVTNFYQVELDIENNEVQIQLKNPAEITKGSYSITLSTNFTILGKIISNPIKIEIKNNLI